MDPTKILQYIQLIQMIMALWMQIQGGLRARGTASDVVIDDADTVASMKEINGQLFKLLS